MKKREKEHLRFVLSDFTYASMKTRVGLRDMERRAHNALSLVMTKAEFEKECKRFDRYKKEAWPGSAT